MFKNSVVACRMLGMLLSLLFVVAAFVARRLTCLCVGTREHGSSDYMATVWPLYICICPYVCVGLSDFMTD